MHFISKHNKCKCHPKLKSIFSRQGIPAILISDEGRQFVSREFKQFTDTWKITHHTSTPHHQQANGMAERAIQTVKNILKKTIENKEDIYLALLSYRNTPVYQSYSPAQILMSRTLRDNIPRTEEQLRPQIINETNFQARLEEQQQNMKYYYDRKTKERKSVQIGERVYYQTHPKSTWKKGIVKHKYNDREILIKRPDGSTLKRNLQFVKINPNSEEDTRYNEVSERRRLFEFNNDSHPDQSQQRGKDKQSTVSIENDANRSENHNSLPNNSNNPKAELPRTTNNQNTLLKSKRITETEIVNRETVTRSGRSKKPPTR